MDGIRFEPYREYDEAEVLALYGAVGWTAYTSDPASLRAGFAASLFTLAAFDGEKLVGVGDVRFEQKFGATTVEFAGVSAGVFRLR